jgi:hypothetical protein
MSISLPAWLSSFAFDLNPDFLEPSASPGRNHAASFGCGRSSPEEGVPHMWVGWRVMVQGDGQRGRGVLLSVWAIDVPCRRLKRASPSSGQRRTAFSSSIAGVPTVT